MTREFPAPDPTRRFSNRVANYLLYRPRYPREVLTILRESCGLTTSHVVADIGSGTGFLTELFLQQGNLVFGVEPNREMREAGEKLLREFDNFISVDARAEETTLSSDSIDLIVAGQAFHWFHLALARPEFVRILRADGHVALIWNERDTTTKLGAAYNQLLHKYCPEVKRVDHRQITDESLDNFFGPGKWKMKTCGNRQTFDFEGLQGRLLSSSYAPEPGQPRYESMIEALHLLFDELQQAGQVVFEYQTNVYVAQLEA